ncbi:MAG: glycosyltransferase family 2 protein [Pedobacter sp.]|uniref:glycosyltransferase family 2 protein n=1 Tax=Pedobacter sp. TaxID=1411316 RepID=UPI002806873F|nr:glycosyltransferase family 2 protein [Pedobacter sp.]MDQ8004873.1 glycosyltransferase family 2 protein [Pedobacter sp.]
MLSVITINLNNFEGLKKTMTSVFKQTYQNFEYIIIDGASSDGSVALIKEYQEKINYWISEKDSGIYQAMNKGIKQANGKFLLFLNSGDTLYHPNILTETAAKIKDDNANIFYTDVNFVDEKLKFAWIKTYPKTVSDSFFIKSSLCHQTMFIEKRLFEEIGLYKENYQLSGDWIFSFDAFKKGSVFKKIDEIVLCNFVLNGFSSDYKLSQKERGNFLHQCYPQYSEQYRLIIKKKGIFTRILLKANRLIANLSNGPKKKGYLRYINSISTSQPQPQPQPQP